jgi:hypothetical protein
VLRVRTSDQDVIGVFPVRSPGPWLESLKPGSQVRIVGTIHKVAAGGGVTHLDGKQEFGILVWLDKDAVAEAP